jgi:hypothetical protein
MMTCAHALNVLNALPPFRGSGAFHVDADEADELVKCGVVVDADPEQLAALERLGAVKGELAGDLGDDPFSLEALKAALAKLEEKLKSEWHRMRTPDAELASEDERRVHLRAVVGELSDPERAAALRKAAADVALLAPEARYMPCPDTGYEVYAITKKGARLRREMSVRLARVADADFTAFTRTFDKVDAKMTALAADVETISGGVGYVRKHKGSVVVGLVKSGLPTAAALDAYGQAMLEARAADVAVTCTRAATAAGSADRAHALLRHAYGELVRAGLPQVPAVFAASKSLLAFKPPESGIPRFMELFRGLNQGGVLGDDRYKFAARLMSAAGYPREILARVFATGGLLGSSLAHPQAIAVAIASMVQSEAQLPAAVQRFRELYNSIWSAYQHRPDTADLALEVMGSAGTVEEVMATLEQLRRSLLARPGGIDPLPVAAAFAKRFAY